MIMQKYLLAVFLVLLGFTLSWAATASSTPLDVAATGRDSAVIADHFDAEVHAQLEHVGRRLNLSPAQQAAIQKILDEQLPHLHARMRALRENQTALRNMTADDPNLEQLATTQGKTISDIILIRKRIQTAVRKQLTETQQRQLHRILARRCHRSRHTHHFFGHLWCLSTRRR